MRELDLEMLDRLAALPDGPEHHTWMRDLRPEVRALVAALREARSKVTALEATCADFCQRHVSPEAHAEVVRERDAYQSALRAEERLHFEALAELDEARVDVEALRSRTECGGRNVDLTDPNDACQSARVQAARAEKAKARVALLEVVVAAARSLVGEMAYAEGSLADDVGVALLALDAAPTSGGTR